MSDAQIAAEHGITKREVRRRREIDLAQARIRRARKAGRSVKVSATIAAALGLPADRLR